MNNSQNTSVEKATKQVYPLYYLLMTTTVCVVCFAAYLACNLDWLIGYFCVFALLQILWFTVLVRSKNKSADHFTPFYYTFVAIYLLPGVLVLWQMQIYTVMLLYILLPFIIMFHFYTPKYSVYASISSLFFITSIFVISDNVQVVGKYNANYVVPINMMILIIAILFVILFVYFYPKFVYGILDRNGLSVDYQSKKIRTTANKRSKELYDSVIALFETKQIYCHPHYRLQTLADDLHTNIRYLSEAINTHYGGTFESLLNKYRLDFAQKMLDDGLAEKFTIEYIYTLAGYSSRSAFYKNFQNKFNMTPTEYQQMRKT